MLCRIFFKLLPFQSYLAEVLQFVRLLGMLLNLAILGKLLQKLLVPMLLYGLTPSMVWRGLIHRQESMGLKDMIVMNYSLVNMVLKERVFFTTCHNF